MKKFYWAGAAAIIATTILSITIFSQGQAIRQLQRRYVAQQQTTATTLPPHTYVAQTTILRPKPIPITTTPPHTTVVPASTTTTTEPFWASCLKAKSTGAVRLTSENMPRGFSFYGDCYDQNGMFFWKYTGSAGDFWSFAYPEPINIGPDGFATYAIGITNPSGVPFFRRHPKFAKAMTLAEMTPGIVVCGYVENHPLETIITGQITYKAYTFDDLYTGALHMEITTLGGQKGDRYLEDMGVVPFADLGSWSTDHVEKGPCPAR